MQSTLTSQDTDPRDAFVIEPDVVLAARQPSPDPVQELLSHLAHRARTPPAVSVVPEVSVAPEAPVISTPPPAVDTTFRAATIDTIDTKDRPVAPDDGPGIGWWLRRAFVAFMFALCSAFAAAAWTHHGAGARHMIANWLPPFVLAASPMADTPAADTPALQPDSAPVQAAAATDQAPAPPASPAPTSAQAPAAATMAAAPAQPAPSPTTQSMARDVATMAQQIEQLKASIEQLKASQAQMSREIAKNSEPTLRPRASATPPHPVAALPPRPTPAPHKPPAPRQAYLPPPPVITSPQPAYAVPPAMPPPPLPAVTSQPALPEATTAPDGGGPVIRPPMPLR
jgi:hypothetical protein